MKKVALVILAIALAVTGCSVFQAITNVSRLKFKINSVAGFKLAGINIENKKKISDFASVDALKLSAGFINGKLPVQFTIYVDAKNPNNGTGGYPRTDVTLESFPYKLYIDDKETISGDITSNVMIPGVGESSIIELNVRLDLIDFFKDQGYDRIINLALALGGKNGSTSRIKLKAKPIISTPFGSIPYPGEITIVDYQFN